MRMVPNRDHDRSPLGLGRSPQGEAAERRPAEDFAARRRHAGAVRRRQRSEVARPASGRYACEASAMSSMSVGPEQGERIPRGPRYHRVLVELPELEAVDARFGPGFSVRPHAHRDHVDSFYVLEGQAEFTLGDELVRAVAGTWISVPAGVVHAFRNVADGDLRILNVHAPNTGFMQRLRGESRLR
jgi:quercetin dioxygenase-like cupin family protein